MRIALVIDSLNSGGAQRQMAMLALLLKRASHDVSLFRYRTRDFFRPMLEGAGIPIVDTATGRFSRIWDMRRQVRGFRPDVAIAFLPTPNLLLELAGLPSREFAIIVSERSNRFANPTLRERLSVNLHRVADAMVANSYEASKGIRNAVPSLNGKVHVITNCVDLEKFVPSEVAKTDSRKVVFSVLARFHDNKNAIGLAQAVRIVMDQHSPDADFVVNWYGNNFYQDGQPTHLSKNYDEVRLCIDALGLGERFILHPPASDVVSIYQNSDAVILPSFIEGCSNVICEALACGRPVLTSRVCDNPLWVADGENGFLFDPRDPDSMAKAIHDFLMLDPASRAAMGGKSRIHAEKELNEDVFLERYTNVINDVAKKYIEAN